MMFLDLILLATVLGLALIIANPMIGMSLLLNLAFILPNLPEIFADPVRKGIQDGVAEIAVSQLVDSVRGVAGNFWISSLARYTFNEVDFFEIDQSGKLKSIYLQQENYLGETLDEQMKRVSLDGKPTAILMIDGKTPTLEIDTGLPIILKRSQDGKNHKIRSSKLILIADDFGSLENWEIEAPVVISSQAAHIGNLSPKTRLIDLSTLTQHAQELLLQIMAGRKVPEILESMNFFSCEELFK